MQTNYLNLVLRIVKLKRLPQSVFFSVFCSFFSCACFLKDYLNLLLLIVKLKVERLPQSALTDSETKSGKTTSICFLSVFSCSFNFSCSCFFCSFFSRSACLFLLCRSSLRAWIRPSTSLWSDGVSVETGKIIFLYF